MLSQIDTMQYCISFHNWTKVSEMHLCAEAVAIKSLFITVCVHGVKVSVRRNDVQSH